MVRKLESNPGSRWYRKNRAYKQHRGYYFRESPSKKSGRRVETRSGLGKWRTPDGRIAKGQTYDRHQREWVLERAVDYNAERSRRLSAIDAANFGRSQGVDVKLGSTLAAYDSTPLDQDPRDGMVAGLAAIFEERGVDFEFDERIIEKWGDS